MKYIKIVFEDAVLYKNNRGTKDVVSLLRKNGTFSRLDKQSENFEEPITVYQVSNLIHVLFGERPVPTFRKTFYSYIDYYFNKANDSYLNIESYKRFNKTANKYDFTKEIVSTKKIVWNSFKKKVDVNWFVIKKYLRSTDGTFTLFNDFVSECNKMFNIDVTKITCYELKTLFLMNNIKTCDVFTLLLNERKTALVQFLSNKENIGSDIFKNYINGVRRTENNGLERVSVLNGTLLIPVNDDDVERIKNISTGFSTILDGGCAYIDSVLEDYEIDNLHEYTKVSNISLKKVKI